MDRDENGRWAPGNSESVRPGQVLNPNGRRGGKTNTDGMPRSLHESEKELYEPKPDMEQSVQPGYRLPNDYDYSLGEVHEEPVSHPNLAYPLQKWLRQF